MDTNSNYFFALFAVLIGIAAGFRSIHEDDRFRNNSKSAAGTGWGRLYLISRGAVSALAFCILYYLGRIKHEPVALITWGVGCGLGGEVVLRSTIYLFSKKEDKAGAAGRQVYFSPLDFLRWWQGYCLERASGPVATEDQQTIRELLPNPPSFEMGLKLFEKNKGALQAYGSNRISKLEKEIHRLNEEYKSKVKKRERESENGQDSNEFDVIYCHQLAYSILQTLGRNAIEIIFKP